MEASWASTVELLQRPERLWSRAEVLTRPTPVPPVAGVYGWHFATAPDTALGSNRLLYVGIAPRHMRPRVSRQSYARASAITSAAMRPDRRCG